MKGCFNCQHNEGYNSNTGNTIGLKTVCSRTDAVASVVTCTVCDNTRVPGIVFFDLESDFHQVGADVSDFGKDTAGNTQCTGAQGFTNGKTDKACAGQIAGNEKQNGKHKN